MKVDGFRSKAPASMPPRHERHGYVVLLGNRFDHWGNAIMRRLRELDPQARIWAPFSGTEKGYEESRIVNRELQSYIELEFESVVIAQGLRDIGNDFESRFQALEQRLKPGAINRILLSDRYYGQAFVQTVNLERTSLTDISRSVAEIKKYLVVLLEWVFARFESTQPRAVFCYCVAGAHSMAIWEVCQAMEIPLRTLEFSRIDNFHHIGTSPFNEFENIGKIFREVVPSAEESLRATQQLALYRNNPVNTDDWSRWSSRLSRLSYVQIIRSFLRNLAIYRRWDAHVENLPGPFTRIFNDARGKVRARKHIGWSDINRLEDLPEKFIFAPLHVDPEASTMVQAPYIQNQLFVIETLARSLPLGITIVVKEHIISLGLRQDSFYKAIKSFPNVKIASPFLDGPKLIEKSSGIATITGTSAWQALILGKPVISFGRPFFHAIEQGFLRVHGWQDLAQKWTDFAAQFKPVSDQKLIDYLTAIYRGSFELPVQAYWSGDTPEQTYLKYPYVADLCVRALLDA